MDALPPLVADDLPDEPVVLEKNDSPLHRAVFDGNEGLVRTLLDSGVDPNVKGAGGRTPLFTAVVTRNASILRILIDSGADLNLSAANGDTPLSLAVLSEHPIALLPKDVLVVRILLESSRLDPNLPGTAGHTPLSLAVIMEKHDLVRMLLACPRVDPNAPTVRGNVPLYYAVTSNNGAAVRILLDSGRVDPNTVCARGRTLLIVAIILERHEAVRALLGCPLVDPNIPDRSSYSPLHCAVSKGNATLVQLLLNSPRLNLNASLALRFMQVPAPGPATMPHPGLTALDLAVWRLDPNTEIIRLLVTAGACPAPGRRNQTVSRLAARLDMGFILSYRPEWCREPAPTAADAEVCREVEVVLGVLRPGGPLRFRVEPRRQRFTLVGQRAGRIHWPDLHEDVQREVLQRAWPGCFPKVPK